MGTMDMEIKKFNESTGTDDAVAGAAVGAAAFAGKKGIDAIKKGLKGLTKKAREEKVDNMFDKTIEQLDKQISQAEERVSDFVEDKKEADNPAKKEQIQKKIDQAQNAVKKLTAKKRAMKEKKRKAKEAIFGKLESREHAICSIILGEDFELEFLGIDIDLLKATPSQIKEAYKKFIISEKKHSGPCWKTHKMVGMKKNPKGGGVVPNCVPREDVDKDVDEFVNPKDVIRGYEKNQTFTSTLKGSESEFKQLVKDLKRAKLSAKIDGKPKKDSIDFYVIGKRIDVRNAQKKLQRKYDISDFMAESVNENRAIVYNPRMIRAFIKQAEKKFPKYKGEIQVADEPDEIVFPNDPKLIKFFKGAREVKFVLSDSVEITEETFNMFFGGYDSDWHYFKKDAKKMRAKLTNIETQFGGDYYFTMNTSKSNLKKLLKKYGDLELEESVQLEENAKKAIEDSLSKFSGNDKTDVKDLLRFYNKKDYDGFTRLMIMMDTSPAEYMFQLISKEDAKFMKKAYPNAKRGDYIRAIMYNRVYPDAKVSKARMPKEGKDKSVEENLKKFMKGAKKKFTAFGESVNEVTECPPATKDVKINTQNRDKAFKAEHIKYGPVNVDEPGDYYEKMAEYFDSTVDAVKKMKCENCVAFDISPSMEKCMPGSVQEDGRLGYCWMHHFKCHSERTCYTWAKGGPITTDEVSDDWGSRAFNEKTMTFAQYNEALNEKQIKGLKKKADETGIPYGILKKVFDRGMAAWKGGHRPGATPHQWAFARVNSFATKSKGTWGGADKDLAAKARSAMESIDEAKDKEAAFDGKDSDYKKLIKDLKKLKIKVKDEDEMDGFKILKLNGSDYAIDKVLNQYPDLQIDEAVFNKKKGYQSIKSLDGKNIEIMLYKNYPAVGKMHDGIIPGRLRIINPNLFQIMGARGMKGAGFGNRDRLSFRLGDVEKIDKNKIYLKPEYKPPFQK